MDRRALLRASALGLSSAFLPSLKRGARQAHAAAPTRLLIVTSQHQVIPDAWLMRRGNPGGKPFSYRFADVAAGEMSDCLAPLAGIKDRLTAIEGLSLFTGIAKESVNNHDAAHQNLLTAAGQSTSDAKRVFGPSVDQIIANDIKVAGRLASIEMGPRSKFTGGFVALGAGTKAPTLDKPTEIFRTLFANVSTGTQVDPGPEALLAAAHGDALDLAANRYKALAPRLSSEDRTKLQQHLGFLSDFRAEFGSAARVSCDALPTVTDGGTNPELVKKWGRLAAHAFACDVTRVATIQIAQLKTDEFGAPSGDVHQDYAHNNGSASGIANMRKYTVTTAKAFASVVDEVHALGLLDSTMVVWMSEHGLFNDPHKMEEAPVLMAGNANGAFNVGRYISVPRASKSARGAMVGTPHSHFFVSLMNAMGSKRDFINIESWAGVSLKGGLAELNA